MEISQLLPGSPIEISILNSLSAKEYDEKHEGENTFLSSLFDITKGGDVVVHIPTQKGRLISLPMDISYLIVINTNVGLFSFEGLLINKGKIENFPVYVFKPNTDLKKIQRRDYFRFDCVIPVIVHPIPREIGLLPTNELIDAAINTELDDVTNDVSASIVDISGGGARFNALLDINTDSFMLLTFSLHRDTGDIPMKIVARRVKSSYMEDAKAYEHRVEFLFKESDDREQIIKFIFDEQRRLRKKSQG